MPPKTLLFAVNTKQKRFFAQIRDYLKGDADLIESKALWLPSLRALRYLSHVDLDTPAALKREDFIAKRGGRGFAPLIGSFYKIVALYTFMRYFYAITPRYAQLMLWNGILFRQAIAVEVAKVRGMRVFYAETGLLPGRITVDAKGVNYYNSVPRDKAFFERYRCDKPLPDTLIPRNPKNAKKFASDKRQPLPERYVFIPFQVDYDSQILTHSPWIRDMRMLFEIVAQIAQKMPDLHFVFKEHPSSIKSYPDLHAKAAASQNLHFANAWPTQTLIQKSAAVITVNSTVGIESLLFHKRVIVLGNAFYAIDGITESARSAKALQRILANLDAWQPDTMLIDNFLKYLYYDYQIEGSIEKIAPGGLQKIANLLNRGE